LSHNDCSLEISLTETGAVTTNAGRCLEVAGPSRDNGTQIHLAPCKGTLEQNFSVVGELRGLGDLCLNAGAAFLDEGSPVLVAPCDGATAERWELFQ